MSPLDKGESVSEEVARILRIIDSSGIDYELNAMGTILEGSWDEVMALVGRCHRALEEDCRRITTTMKIDYRQDATRRLTSKVESVEKKVGRQLNTGRSS